MFEAKCRDENPDILALTRNRFTQEPPKGRKLEGVKAQMLRIHRAAGHSSFANLQNLLRARKAPQWAIDLAGQLTCPDCKEAQQPPSPPVASLQEQAGLFEVIGSDIFEWEHENHTKYKFQLIRDSAYGGTEGPSAWEPTTSDVIRGFSHWLMHNPAPRWILTDGATYFTSQQMMDFAGRSGIGLLTTPAESHQMLGAEEGSIRVLKSTVKRLVREEPTIAIEDAFMLAAHGHNQSVGPSGFSPFQWTRGSASPSENLPLGLDPKKAFDGVLRLKEKAKPELSLKWKVQNRDCQNSTIPFPDLK